MDLSNVSLGGLVTDDFSVDAAGWQQASDGNSPFDADWNGSGGNLDGFVSVTNTALDALLTDLALIAPSKYLGDQSAAFGKLLAFSLRGFGDGISSVFNLQSPYVLLVADVPTDPNPIPEPSTVLLLAGSLGALRLARRSVSNS
ncbi:MAG: PEP-CTERM sorting domain-containing protein [Burkholderiales bacterium]